MFTLIFVGLFVSAWLLVGLMPWLVVSVATRGNAGLGNLPLSMFAGLVGGLAVPVLGKDDLAGIWLSMAAAAIVAEGFRFLTASEILIVVNTPQGQSDTAIRPGLGAQCDPRVDRRFFSTDGVESRETRRIQRKSRFW